MERVAIIGLGAMGRGMAANLLGRGRAITVYNRTAGRAEGLTGDMRVASSPADAAKGASFIITMVADDAAIESVVEGKDGLLASMDADAVHISMSTIGVAAARDLARAMPPPSAISSARRCLAARRWPPRAATPRRGRADGSGRKLPAAA